MRLTLAIALVGLAPAFAVAKPLGKAEAPLDFTKLKAESIDKWSGADRIVVGSFSEVIAGPVGASQPPYRTYRMTVKVDAVLRGAGPKDAKEIAVAYSVRQETPPTFPGPNQKVLIGLKTAMKTTVLVAQVADTPEAREQAQLASAMPLGWSMKDGKLVSPWAASGAPFPKTDGGPACSVTGRPLLLAGSFVEFSVAPAPPAKEVKFRNPDGDGDYLVSVTNRSAGELVVPALLTDGKAILWNESLVFRVQNKNYACPGAKAVPAGAKGVTLKGGETVTGKVSPFGLTGPEWPRGGYRIEFQFCLGERSATHSFYYFSAHHDPIRDRIQKSLAGK